MCLLCVVRSFRSFLIYAHQFPAATAVTVAVVLFHSSSRSFFNWHVGRFFFVTQSRLCCGELQPDQVEDDHFSFSLLH